MWARQAPNRFWLLLLAACLARNSRIFTIKGSRDTQSLFRLCPLGFSPLGADRPVLCGAWTDPGIGTLATSFHRTNTILGEHLTPRNASVRRRRAFIVLPQIR